MIILDTKPKKIIKELIKWSAWCTMPKTSLIKTNKNMKGKNKANFLFNLPHKDLFKT
jgi:hypothetical protein